MSDAAINAFANERQGSSSRIGKNKCIVLTGIEVRMN
jgi:hypothetical protein